MIEQLLYTSHATAAMKEAEWRRIEDVSSVHNVLNGITGLLAYDGERVMQLLEGNQDKIAALFDRIERDRRHHEIIVHHRKPHAVASYGEWAMRFCQLPEGGADSLPGLERLMAPSLPPELRQLMVSWGGRRD